jgi:XapX domain-containing protein
MKSVIGIMLAFALGFACRAFGIPSPAPPLILGALLVMAMTIGYIVVDQWALSPAKRAPDCGGPSGLSASQTVSELPYPRH